MELLILIIILVFFTSCIYVASQEPENWNTVVFGQEYAKELEDKEHIKEYKNFMNATGKNTLKDIAEEFNEDISLVEKNIRRAIRNNWLKGYYLCNQTGEILPIKKRSGSISIKESKSIKIKE